MMNIKVLAEGVETEAEVHCMLQAGIDHFQGYFFARPEVETLAGEADIVALADGFPVPCRTPPKVSRPPDALPVSSIARRNDTFQGAMIHALKRFRFQEIKSMAEICLARNLPLPNSRSTVYVPSLPCPPLTPVDCHHESHPLRSFFGAAEARHAA